ncbi:hypothetical protein KCU83_g305, partial [Aureobasidium melanogenum]
MNHAIRLTDIHGIWYAYDVSRAKTVHGIAREAGWITASSSTHVVSAVYETRRSLIQSRTTKGSVKGSNASECATFDAKTVIQIVFVMIGIGIEGVWSREVARKGSPPGTGPEETGVQGHESGFHWASQQWSPRRTSVGGMADKANASTAIDWTRASLLSMLAVEGGLGGARRLDVWLLNRRGGLCVHKTVSVAVWGRFLILSLCLGEVVSVPSPCLTLAVHGQDHRQIHEFRDQRTSEILPYQANPGRFSYVIQRNPWARAPGAPRPP